ncbi:MAG: hypothetical protein NC311_08655 [Muribaculaceae bacterium]|nr:hypothetical protein [Muribaculaceae bacterium]MCM1399878.1 hypothetical protein [Clostridium sp.]MCM1460636.1 hypothetical protein [Bacteroides sp.]
METKDNKVFLYLGLIDAIIGISDFVIKAIKNSQIVISPLTKICILVLLICIMLYFVINNVTLGYTVRKYLSYWLRRQDSYTVLNKECIYTYLSKDKIEYTKKHEIISNVNNLQHFSDKFKWSKNQSVSEINIVDDNPNHEISVKRIENWHQYSVEFEQLGKRQEETIKVTIKDLNDPYGEAMPFLSSNVVYKTKKLRLVIHFNDPSLKPINIKYKIFDNYASDYPLIQKNLEYDDAARKIEKSENKPIYGFRYVITWDFKND